MTNASVARRLRSVDVTSSDVTDVTSGIDRSSSGCSKMMNSSVARRLRSVDVTSDDVTDVTSIWNLLKLALVLRMFVRVILNGRVSSSVIRCCVYYSHG